MTDRDVDVIRDFHQAFEMGDFDSMTELLAPDVTWRGAGQVEGEGCTNRDMVMGTLRERADNVPPLDSLQLADLGEDVLVGLPGHEPWDHAELYQRVRVADGVIAAIQDYETRDEAIAAGTA